MHNLYTIGYEGAGIDDFIDTLRRVGVSLLVDIRDVAVSRRKGFSKSSLLARVEKEGMEYLHLRALGDPKPGRVAARSGKIAEFERIFREHIASPDAEAALAALAELAEEKVVCLLCYERSPKTCHRNIVAAMVEDRANVVVRHLGVTQPKRMGDDGRIAGKGSCSGESAPTRGG